MEALKLKVMNPEDEFDMKQWIIDHESLPFTFVNISEKAYRRVMASYRKYPIRAICSNTKLMMMLRDIFNDY